MPSLTVDAVTAKVRTRLQLTASEMSDADIESLIDDALIEFGHHKILDVYGVILLSQDQQDYPFSSLSPSAQVEEVLDVLYSPGTLLYDAISFDAELQKVIDADLLRAQMGGNIFDNPSLGEAYFQKLSQYRDRFDVGFEELDTPNGKIVRLSRTPIQDSTAYFRGRGIWQIEQIGRDDTPHFYDCVFALVCEARANFLALHEQYSENPGVSYRPAIKAWTDAAEKYRKQFEDHYGGSAGILQCG